MNGDMKKAIKDISKKLVVGTTINVFSLLSVVLNTVINSDMNDLDRLKVIKLSLDRYVELYGLKEN